MSELSVGLLSGESDEAEDPYYICQRTIQAKLDQLKQKYGMWSNRFKKCNTAAAEFQQLHKDVLRLLKAANGLYKTLETSVRAVERARKQFPNISNAEIASRKRFVSRTLKTLKKVEATVTSQETLSKIVLDRRQLLLRGSEDSNSTSKAQRAPSRMTSGFVDRQDEQNESEMKHQDQSIDRMISGLDTLHDSGMALKNEIEDQKQLLTDMDKNVRGARAKLQQVTGRMKGFLNTKDDCHLWTMISLAVIAVVLLIMNVLAFLL